MTQEKQKALLVGVNLNNEPDFDGYMKELESLAEACELEVLGRFEQNLNEINAATYLGSGKTEELCELCENMGADVLVFNNELSPSQLSHLAKKTGRSIFDRTSLILEIFASRAKTKEAKMQVEVARLQYMLPRLVGANAALSRQGGGSGLRNRGAGEKKLELNRRQIEQRIADINHELKAVEKERQVRRRQRQKNEIPCVALVGYTNAGKSTVMNAMLETYRPDEEKSVFEQDMLFATLDTSVRNITLPNNKAFLLSDTVGFVSQLPHNLVKAFRSTLEEVRQADLLLHVVDFSNQDFKQQMEITQGTIEEIGAGEIPVLYVYNKADLTELTIPMVVQNGIYLSAKQRIGIPELAEQISKRVFGSYVKCEMLIPYEKGEVVAYLSASAHVEETQYEPEGTRLIVECRPKDYQKYRQYVRLVRK